MGGVKDKDGIAIVLNRVHTEVLFLFIDQKRLCVKFVELRHNIEKHRERMDINLIGGVWNLWMFLGQTSSSSGHINLMFYSVNCVDFRKLQQGKARL